MARFKLPGLDASRLASWRPQVKIAVPVGLVAATIGFVIASVWIWSWPLSSADRLTAIGDAAAITGLALAAFGAVLALAAYLVASQSPNLEAEFEFLTAGERNHPVLQLGEPDGRSGARPVVVPGDHDPAIVRIRNLSSFAARNAAIRIDLVGLEGLRDQTGWTMGYEKRDSYRQQWVQWEGGADLAIHGNWIRALPPLTFKDASVNPGVDIPVIVITLVADAMPPKWQTIHIDIKDEAGFAAYLAGRQARAAKQPGTCEIAGCSETAKFVIVSRIPGHAAQTLRVCPTHRSLRGRNTRLRAGGTWIPLGDADVETIGEIPEEARND